MPTGSEHKSPKLHTVVCQVLLGYVLSLIMSHTDESGTARGFHKYSPRAIGTPSGQNTWNSTNNNWLVMCSTGLGVLGLWTFVGILQLASVQGDWANSEWLRPRVLHLGIQCHDHHLINTLWLLPDPEELVLGLVRPSELGKMFFNTMAARYLKMASSSSGLISDAAQPNGVSNNIFIAALVPQLKSFGVRYQRWIRKTEKTRLCRH
jgi:hypothetical protein